MRELLIASVFGIFTGVMFNMPWGDILWPLTPYKSVTVHNSGIVGDEYRIHATFRKTDCDFQNLSFHGKGARGWDRLEWRDVGGEAGDRVEGWHTFDLYADLDGGIYDLIEVRTRHLCTEIEDGKEVTTRVDKVFFAEDI